MNLRLSNLRLNNLRLKPWQRWTAYAVFGLLAFALALRQTFPSDAVKERIILEAASAGWQVNVVDVRPSGFGGIDMSGVTLESRDGVRIPVERVDANVRVAASVAGQIHLYHRGDRAPS